MSQTKSSTASNDVNPEVWLDEHGDALYRFAFIRVHDSHTAEDLVQETLVSGMKSIESFRGRSSLRTWLMSILRRRIADHIKRAGRPSHLHFASLQSDDESNRESFAQDNALLFKPAISSQFFESAIERSEFQDIVRECIRELPTHFQEAFLMRMSDDGSTLAELSAKLDVTQTNLSVRLYRARLFLRACLERKWLNG